jgi:uncharacterized repeat protein (TIGR01451 family)
LTVSNATITGGETTGVAAGIFIYESTRGGSYSATLSLTNAIVAANVTADEECIASAGVTTSGSGNLFTNNASCPGGAVNADPLLSPLATEAPGLTPTMAIDDSSPAYDAGDDDFCEPFDQRGVSRPRSLHCDIGAYEYIKPSADLAGATTNLGTPIAGSDLAYLIDVHNNGSTAAENVTVTITPPSVATFVSISGSGGFACAGSAPVTCTKALMVEGTTALFTLTVHLPAALVDGTSITNSVTVGSSKTADPVPGNNTASVTIGSTTRADLSVTKTGPTSPIAGADVAYTIGVRNLGPSVGRNVQLSDVIPAGVTFQSLAAPAGWSCAKPAAGTAGPSNVSCSTARLGAGASATFTLTVRPSASTPEGSELCNTATVTTTTADPEASNNASSACGTIRTLADLVLTQTASTTGKPGKGTATFRLVVTNLGPSDSRNVSLTATSSLFTGPAPSTSATTGATCVTSEQTITCTWATVPVGGTVSVEIVVPWRSSVGKVCTTGTVSAGAPDPSAVNNTAIACTSKR